MYGKIWGGFMPNIGPLPLTSLYVQNEDNVRHVLRENFNNYLAPPLDQIFHEVLGKGIFSSTGDQWKMQRKVISTMFTRNLMRSAVAFTVGKMLEMVRLFHEGVAEAQNSVGNEDGFVDVDIQEVFHRLTFDIICLVAFGVDLKCVENEKQHEFPRAFNEIIALSQTRMVDFFFKFKRYLGIGQREKRIHELNHVIQGYSRIIKDKESESEISPEGFDLFSKYITYAKKSNVKVSDGNLKDLSMSMLLAGKLVS